MCRIRSHRFVEERSHPLNVAPQFLVLSTGQKHDLAVDVSHFGGFGGAGVVPVVQVEYASCWGWLTNRCAQAMWCVGVNETLNCQKRCTLEIVEIMGCNYLIVFLGCIGSTSSPENLYTCTHLGGQELWSK